MSNAERDETAERIDKFIAEVVARRERTRAARREFDRRRRYVRGPVVEIGPYSVTPSEARLMATSLTILANAVDDGPEAPPPDVTRLPRELR